jgi:hypothetical protein
VVVLYHNGCVVGNELAMDVNQQSTKQLLSPARQLHLASPGSDSIRFDDTHDRFIRSIEQEKNSNLDGT